MIIKILGFAGLLGCLAIVYYFETSSHATGILRIFHWPALVLTGIGPMMLVIVASDFSAVLKAVGYVFGTNAPAILDKHEREAILLQKIGKSFYVEGAQAFENVKMKGMSTFIRKMLERLSMRMPMQDIRDLLEAERDRVHHRLFQATNVLGLAVKLTPSVGMLGTIMGMVNLLSSMSDPSKIGESMSLALLTTFFGLFFSLVIWTPLQQKVERVTEAEIDGYNKAIRWIEVLEKRKPAEYYADSVDIPVEHAPEGKRARAA